MERAHVLLSAIIETTTDSTGAKETVGNLTSRLLVPGVVGPDHLKNFGDILQGCADKWIKSDSVAAHVMAATVQSAAKELRSRIPVDEGGARNPSDIRVGENDMEHAG